MKNKIQIDNVTLDIPVIDAEKSIRKSFFNYCVGGKFIHDPSKNQLKIRALDNISLQIQEGDRIGLIGRNGSGKSSLLRVIAGIYQPTVGILTVQGKIAPLLNIAIGLEWDSSGIENISRVGLYLGMTKKEIHQKLEDIIAFSELGDFIKLPVRTYSNGMLTRLTFSIATALDPEILLIDEGFGMGDEHFTRHAKERLTNFYQKTNILVIATHAPTLIKEFCTKAALLDQGKLLTCGNVEEVLDIYYQNIKEGS